MILVMFGTIPNLLFTASSSSLALPEALFGTIALSVALRVFLFRGRVLQLIA